MPPQFASVTPILRMFDVRKAREFYLDFPGFQVDSEHMGISLGSAVLHLSEHHGDCAPGARVISRRRGLRTIRLTCLPSATAMPGRDWSDSPGAPPP